jgi:hypothetical protein
MLSPLSGVYRAGFSTQVIYQSAFKNDHEIPHTADYLRNKFHVDRLYNGTDDQSWKRTTDTANLCVGTVSYHRDGKSHSACHSDIDSNGRTNFFTRWWNQPELERHGEFLRRNVKIDFHTPRGKTITKEVRMIEIGVENTGNDDAFEPQIRAIPLLQVPDSKKEIQHGMFPLSHVAVLLPYRNIKTRSERPEESELAILFLMEGLQVVPFIEGHSSRWIVFGFSFRDGAFFHLASEEAVTFVSLPIEQTASLSFKLEAKARNSGKGLLCNRATLNLSSIDAIKLIPF